MSGMFKSLGAWVEHRTGLFTYMHDAMYERVPGGARWRFVFGSMLVFCFITQVFTGIILWMSYSPSANTAWESVYYIQTQMTWGWVVRGLHHFTAQAMVVLLAFHMLQVVWDGAYKPPREFNYWIGLILAQIVLGLALTGYLLPWDQKGYWATKVATNLMGLTPAIGDQVQKTAVGGVDYGHHTLTRFFAMHAGVLPALLVVFLVIHLAVFRRHGVTAESSERRPDQYFWPNQVLLDAIAFLVLLVGLLGFIWYRGGAELTAPADPSEQYSAARPEWYFLFLFQLLKKFESEFVGAIVVPGVIMAYLFAMPLIARIKGGHWLNVAVIVVLIVGAGYLTIEAWVQDNYAAPVVAQYLPLAEDADEETVREHNELYTASENYLAAAEQAHRDYERVEELIEHHGGIPVEGAIALQRRDSETMGPRLFKLHCASCHDYVDPEGVDPMRIETARYEMPVTEGEGDEVSVKKDEDGDVVYQDEPVGAPNLYGVGTREWLAGFLDPEKISLLETSPPESPQPGDPASDRREITAAPFFGATAHHDGMMAEFVKSDLTEDAMDEEQTANLKAIIAAVSAQANLKSQAEADQQARQSGLIEQGTAAFEEYFASYACSDCHKMGEVGYEGSAPDLTGWMSEEWMTEMIANPNHIRFYGYEEGANDRMPAFAANEDDPRKNILSEEEIRLIVRWLRGDDADLATAPAEVAEAD